jgi:Phosphoribosylformylglycinamidine (FGAM) synthase, synthetase domain
MLRINERRLRYSYSGYGSCIGLTCSSVEMGDKGNLGIKINLDNVPKRESKMTDYETMLSESQERMLAVIKPGTVDNVKGIFEKWD